MRRDGTPNPARWAALLAALVTLALGGCDPHAWRTRDGRIATGKINYQREPSTGRYYHLYVPTSYDPRRAYPLVIAARGTQPFDFPLTQRNKWAELAESHDLIICAPWLQSASAFLAFPADGPAEALLRDEEATLAIIEQLKARYHINEDAILITGWSGGAYTAYFVGMRSPDLFRCIISRTGNFHPRLVSDEEARRARHMHVYLFYSNVDLPFWDKVTADANFWFTEHGFLNLRVGRHPGLHSPNQPEAVRYFLNVVNHWPVVRVKATPAGGPAPLAVRFEAVVRDPDAPAGRLASALWDFGDGTTAVGAAAEHTYDRPGRYNVVLRVRDLDGHVEYGQGWIDVGKTAPLARAGAAESAPAGP